LHKLTRELRRPVDRFFAKPVTKFVTHSFGAGKRFVHAAARRRVGGYDDRFALYRILGNDLKGRHGIGQTLANLKFVLENEPELPSCKKLWVINRVSDRDTQDALSASLMEAGREFITIEFDPREYAKVRDAETARDVDQSLREKIAGMNENAQLQFRMSLVRARCLYAMNINGARNAAIAAGVDQAEWILPWDGNCFVTEHGWRGLSRSVLANKAFNYHVVPMVRLRENSEIKDPNFYPDCNEEPQILFGRGAVGRFDERLPYGRRDKTELLTHLSVPGPWDSLKHEVWDVPKRASSSDRHLFNMPAGWVARLSSGSQEAEIGMSERYRSRAKAILAYIEQLDQSV